MTQPSRVRTLYPAQSALQISPVLHSEQLRRCRSRVQNLGIVVEDRELAAFARSTLHTERRLEQDAGFVRIEVGPICVWSGRRRVQSRLAKQRARGADRFPFGAKR